VWAIWSSANFTHTSIPRVPWFSGMMPRLIAGCPGEQSSGNLFGAMRTAHLRSLPNRNRIERQVCTMRLRIVETMMLSHVHCHGQRTRYVGVVGKLLLFMSFGALSPEIALGQQQYHAVGFTPFTVEEANELAKPSPPSPDGRACPPFYDVSGINNRGALIGAAYLQERKLFLFDEHGRVPVSSGVQPGPRPRINDAGQFIASVAGVTNEHAELVSGGKPLEIGAGWAASYATDINGRGQVTGWVETNRIDHAFLLTGNETHDLGSIGASESIGRALNASGDVVGELRGGGAEQHAFLYHNGKMLDLGTLGGRTSYALGINDRAEIAGTSETSSGHKHAFLYSNGVMKDLGTLGGDVSEASGINNEGIVVGSSETSNHRWVAFVYSNGAMKALSDLVTSWDWRAFANIVPANERGVPELSGVTAINNKGQIVANSDWILCAPVATFVLTPIGSAESSTSKTRE
jgi:probable HAF family extracellular repeat protein